MEGGLQSWSWQSGATWLTQPIVLLGAGLLAAILAVWLLIRARRPLPLRREREDKPERAKGEWIAGLRRRVDALAAALRYLSTRREWRYASPWVLLLGEPDGGKSSLAASLSDGRREAALLQERSLPADGADWYFCSGGIVIDPAGAAAEPGSKEDRKWHDLLRAIDARRPERALDSTVLVVSADALLGTDMDALRHLAERCYRQLWQVQKAFEFVLPLHVVISRCDAVPGFGAFWRSQPERSLRALWGWSNPSLNDHAAPGEIARATLDEIGGALRRMQIEAAARLETIEDADDFFLFPQRLAQVQGGLEILLETVLKPSVHHAGFYFRGVYFCGSVAADGERERGVCDSVDFADALFHDKIFKERGLARPLRQSVWSRNRLLRKVQTGILAGFVLLCLGLGWNALSLSRQLRDIQRVEQSLAQDTGKQSEMDGKCIAYSAVYRLLDQVGQLRADMVYPFIPVSWVDHSVAEGVGQWLADRSFKGVVMPSLECKLRQEARDLYKAKGETDGKKPAGAAIQISDIMERSRGQMIGMVHDALAYERNSADFHKLTGSVPRGDAEKPVEIFEGLARAIYNEPLPPSLMRGNGAYDRMIANLRYDEKPDQLDEDFHAVIAENMVAAGKAVQKNLLDGIDLGNRLLAGVDQDRLDPADVIAGVRDWMRWLRARWLNRDGKHDLCAEIGRELTEDFEGRQRGSIYGSSLDALKALFTQESSCRAPAVKRLRALSVPPYGPLVQEVDGYLELNPMLASEMLGLEAVDKLPFMKVKHRRAFICQPSLSGWLDPPLAEIDGFLRDYQLFAVAAKLDPAAAPLYDRLTRRHLQNVIASLLVDAQRTTLGAQLAADPEARAADQSAAFSAQREQLAKISAALVQIGDAAGAAKLTDCLRNYATDALNRIDDLALGSRLYHPKPAADSDAGAGEKIYPFSDAAAVRDYLQRQRDRVAVLANYSEPYVRYLDASAAVGRPDDREEAVSGRTRWRATLAELNRYQAAKDSGGTLGALENYFSASLAQFTYDNCARLLEKADPVTDSGDLFSASHAELMEQNSVRCYRRREADAAERYAQLAKRFNLELAGYYPFAAPSARDLDNSVARSFFRDYAAERAALRHMIAGLKGDRWPEIGRFLDQLDGAAKLLEPSLAAADTARPLRLDVTFRALPKLEKGAEQLIGWDLFVGGQRIAYPGQDSQLDWGWGEPLELDLTWASQSAWRPAPASDAYRADGATAAFAADGQWGLLRWIEAHRPRGAPEISPLDPAASILEFVVPLDEGGEAKGEARLYLSVKVNAVDGKGQAGDSLLPPRTWPRAAPSYW